MRDIANVEDITCIVDAFYDKVLSDDLLSPFFVNLNFEQHKPKMIQFWSFVLLNEAGYTTDVTQKHMKMRLEKKHFDKWLELFNSTVDSLFVGEKADFAKQRASLVGWTIQSKIQANN